MKEFKAKLKILKVEKRNNSYYGNPSYQLTVQTENGEVFVGRTSTNAALAYDISYTWEGEWKILAYHFTKSGNCIFDRKTTIGHTKEIDEVYSNLVKKIMGVL